MIELPELIFETQLCAKWDVSAATLYRERKAGKLRCTPIGGRIAYTQTQIEDYLRLKNKEAATQPCRTYRSREKKPSPSSGTTGSNTSKSHPTSTSRGTTSAPAKSAENLHEQTFFKKPK